jgi:hypothetical protein
MVIEIEEFVKGSQSKLILVSTGKLANISSVEIFHHFANRFAHPNEL